MKLTLVLGFLSAAAVWAADTTPLDLKTGEWEYTVSMQMSGMPQAGAARIPQIPPEQLAKLPPEQRAKVEEAMKRASGMLSGKPTVNRSCVRKEDLANFNPTNMPKSCKMTVTSSSRTRFEAKIDCDTPDNKSTATLVAEAATPESMKFHVVSSGTAQGHPMNMTLNGTGRWLSSTCSDAK